MQFDKTNFDDHDESELIMYDQYLERSGKERASEEKHDLHLPIRDYFPTNYIPQAIKDEYVEDENDVNKCCDCFGKAICETRCPCQKKLCQFHIRFGLEDSTYFECDRCTEIEYEELNGRKVWLRKGGNIWCQEHVGNNLSLVDRENNIYSCQEHFKATSGNDATNGQI